MDLIRSYSIRSFVWIMFFMVILFIMVAFVFSLTLTTVIAGLPSATGNGALPQGPGGFISPFGIITESLPVYFIPLSVTTFIFLGILLWLLLRVSLVKLQQKTGGPGIKQPVQVKEKPLESKKEKREKTEKGRRLFLHLLAVFQREGRLIDFFSEDLNLYEDAQIGAAVRSVHENCKKTIHKYIAPKPVIDKDEGDEVTVQPDFDPDAVKLTGNVTGDPPFKGILRHKGWQASKLDLPTLAGSKDSKVIAPAEIEIK